MRVTQDLSPSFLHRIQFKAPVLAAVMCAVLAVSGCAGRSVLGEKPAATTVGGPEVVPENGAQTTTVTKLQKFLWFFSPYRPVIQQGNFISEEMMAQIKTGMTRDQVRFVLGTPLLQDIFHAERWDYPFRLAKGNGELTTSRVVIFFDKEGKVARFEGGNLPTEKEYIARIAGPAPVIAKKDQPAAAPAPAAAPVAPAASTSGETVPAAPVVPVTPPATEPAAPAAAARRWSAPPTPVVPSVPAIPVAEPAAVQPVK